MVYFGYFGQLLLWPGLLIVTVDHNEKVVKADFGQSISANLFLLCCVVVGVGGLLVCYCWCLV